MVLDDTKITITDSTQTIFTLLARVSLESYGDFDTKWFPVDHEACAYKGRFLLSDTVSVSALNIHLATINTNLATLRINAGSANTALASLGVNLKTVKIKLDLKKFGSQKNIGKL